MNVLSAGGCGRQREVGDKLSKDGELLSVAVETLSLACGKPMEVSASIYLADDKLAAVDDK